MPRIVAGHPAAAENHSCWYLHQQSPVLTAAAAWVAVLVGRAFGYIGRAVRTGRVVRAGRAVGHTGRAVRCPIPLVVAEMVVGHTGRAMRRRRRRLGLSAVVLRSVVASAPAAQTHRAQER